MKAFSIKDIEYNDSFKECLNEVLIKAHEKAEEFSKVNMGTLTPVRKDKILKSIEQTFNYFTYNPNYEYGIFTICAKIFSDILMNHYLTNGNKRLAIVFIKELLWELGYYFKFTKSQWDDYDNDLSILKMYVVEFDELDRDIVEETISIWFKDNSTIANKKED